MRTARDRAFTCSCQIFNSFIRSLWVACFLKCQQCFEHFSILKRWKFAPLTKWRRQVRNGLSREIKVVIIVSGRREVERKPMKSEKVGSARWKSSSFLSLQNKLLTVLIFHHSFLFSSIEEDPSCIRGWTSGDRRGWKSGRLTDKEHRTWNISIHWFMHQRRIREQEFLYALGTTT